MKMNAESFHKENFTLPRSVRIFALAAVLGTCFYTARADEQEITPCVFSNYPEFVNDWCEIKTQMPTDGEVGVVEYIEGMGCMTGYDRNEDGKIDAAKRVEVYSDRYGVRAVFDSWYLKGEWKDMDGSSSTLALRGDPTKGILDKKPFQDRLDGLKKGPIDRRCQNLVS